MSHAFAEVLIARLATVPVDQGLAQKSRSLLVDSRRVLKLADQVLGIAPNDKLVRTRISDDLAKVELRVAEAVTLVEGQQQLVATLTLDDHSELATFAAELLAQFEKIRAMHIDDRDRLIKELAQNSDQDT
jgi:hypothetical protein